MQGLSGRILIAGWLMQTQTHASVKRRMHTAFSILSQRERDTDVQNAPVSPSGSGQIQIYSYLGPA
jgi:hypothetical protein